jgi:hypothetical protein
MNEKVHAYLEEQKKESQAKDNLERTKILIEAKLYEAYQGPHVEELFEPIPPQKEIRKIDTIQYVVEKATNDYLAVRYDYKQQTFEVLTPLSVTNDEFNQIKLYAKRTDKPFFNIILFVFSLAFYILAFVMLMIVFSDYSTSQLPLALGAGSLGIGLILHGLAVIIKKRSV